jgi:hypothetical protein
MGSSGQQWTYSSGRNPCPICQRVKDGDCRISTDRLQVICHHPKDLKPGDVENGWAFTGNISDGRAGHFTLDKPANHRPSASQKVVPLRVAPAAVPATVDGPIELARIPEQSPLKGSPWSYGPHQRIERVDQVSGKMFIPQHCTDGRWVKGAGSEPWPVFGVPAPGWVLELEGEKCCELALAAGVAAISQPGHAHKVEQVAERYRNLQANGVEGIVYLADNDTEGKRRADQAVEAAAQVQLPLRVLLAAEVWPGLPAGGSIDDAPGIPAERVSAITAAITERWQTLLREQPTPILDDLLGAVEEGKLRRPRTDKLTQAVGLVLPLRYNLLSNRIECNGEPIHGDYLSGLYLELAEDHAIDVAKERAIDAAMRVARQNAYHPVRDYLNGITDQLTPEEWASLDLHCFGSEDLSGWGVIHLQRQLIGLVARALKPGCELHTCLVLQSDQQGIGKSTFWKLLGGPWFSDSLGDLRDLREDRLQLHSAWIHEWGEIDNVMGKRESETLKRFLSCSRDDVRRPYGRGTAQLLRSCGLVGTTNRRDFIKDPTGNRRFPIIQIRNVKLDWVKANRDRIWGSALAAYKASHPWHYTAAEGLVVSQQAMGYAAEDPLRDRLETWIDDNPTVDNIPLVRVLWDLQHDCPDYWERRSDKEFMRQVALAMTALGWAVAGKRVRYLMPNGKRTDRASHWKRAN